jgi:hypothetical protein
MPRITTREVYAASIQPMEVDRCLPFEMVRWGKILENGEYRK